MHRFSVFSRNVNTINLRFFSTMVEYISFRENSTSIMKRDKALRSLKKDGRMLSSRLILNDKGSKQHCLPFRWF